MALVPYFCPQAVLFLSGSRRRLFLPIRLQRRFSGRGIRSEFKPEICLLRSRIHLDFDQRSYKEFEKKRETLSAKIQITQEENRKSISCQIEKTKEWLKVKNDLDKNDDQGGGRKPISSVSKSSQIDLGRGHGLPIREEKPNGSRSMAILRGGLRFLQSVFLEIVPRLLAEIIQHFFRL